MYSTVSCLCLLPVYACTNVLRLLSLPSSASQACQVTHPHFAVYGCTAAWRGTIISEELTLKTDYSGRKRLAVMLAVFVFVSVCVCVACWCVVFLPPRAAYKNNIITVPHESTGGWWTGLLPFVSISVLFTFYVTGIRELTSCHSRAIMIFYILFVYFCRVTLLYVLENYGIVAVCGNCSTLSYYFVQVCYSYFVWHSDASHPAALLSILYKFIFRT